MTERKILSRRLSILCFCIAVLIIGVAASFKRCLPILRSSVVFALCLCFAFGSCPCWMHRLYSISLQLLLLFALQLYSLPTMSRACAYSKVV